MKLFTFDNYQLTISEEAFAIKAFRDIVNRDKSRIKEIAMLELGYIYFMTDPRSDYAYLSDLEARSDLIIAQEGLPKNWEADELVLKGIKVYEQLTTTTAWLLLIDAQLALDNVRKFLRDIKLEDTDDKGKPKYTINSVVSALKATLELVAQYSEAEKVIYKELNQNTRMKANRDKKLTEDGFDNFTNTI